MLSDRLAALVRRAEDFLDEMERRGRPLDAEEGERLAELLVYLGAGRPDDGNDDDGNDDDGNDDDGNDDDGNDDDGNDAMRRL